MSTFVINEDRPPSAPIVLSSDALVERDRFDVWREELMLKVMRVDVDVPDRMNFRTRVRMLNLPNVREMRLKRARQLLRDPLTLQMRVGDVGAMAGFNDLSHFNRMFRLQFGETPSDARRAG